MNDEVRLQRYVAGFAFNETRSRVALIRKDHPAWQAGKLNGVGGKVEDDEPPIMAMIREFNEEAGVGTAPWRWNRIADLQGVDQDGSPWGVAIFEARLPPDEFGAIRTGPDSPTSEPIEIHPVPLSPHRATVHNLDFLIPLAMDPNRPYVVADYEGVDRAKKAAQQDREHHEED